MDCDRVFAILTRGPFPTGDPGDQAVEDHLLVCPDCILLAEALRPSAQVTQEMITTGESSQLPGYRGDVRLRFSDLAISCIEPQRQAFGPLVMSSAVDFSLWPAGWSALNLGRFALAIVLGATIGVVLRSWSKAAEQAQAQRAAETMAADAPPVRLVNDISTPLPSDQLLANLRRPAACFAAVGGHRDAPGNNAHSQQPPDGAQHTGVPAGALLAAGVQDSNLQDSGERACDNISQPLVDDLTAGLPPHRGEARVCCIKCHHPGASPAPAATAASVVRRSCTLCHGDMQRSALQTW